MDQTILSSLEKPHRHSGPYKEPPDSKGSGLIDSAVFQTFPRQDLERSITARFEEQVRLFPHRLAVKTESHSLGYQELNDQANRIAQMILFQKGSRAQPIALVMEAGCSMMAAIFGILKAGRFFIPLDPLQPTARGRDILLQAQTDLILADSHTLSTATELCKNPLRLINIDQLDHTLSSKNPEVTIAPDHLAYIIYTSGSTGQPKGVMQTHRNVLHKTMEHTNSAHIWHEDRLGLLYSPSFSGAMRDIFSALLNGAGLFPFNLKQEGMNRLSAWLIQEDITVYNSAATVFRHFMGTLMKNSTFQKLRLIQLGSEPIYASDVDSFKIHFPKTCQLIARYGSSEISPIRWLSINHETQIPGNIVPGGYPIPEVDVVIVEEHGQEVGVNQVGEISVKSRFLTPGYWRMPELTQSKFQPDPTDPARRVFRTGDLGYFLPDGCLVPIGRTDSQVKIRGYRIEIGEIEAALLKIKIVKEAAVVAKDDPKKGNHLVAYLVLHKKEKISTNELRCLLPETLPDYMIPETFVYLQALPLIGPGKIDRRSLAHLEGEVAVVETVFAAPRTMLEELVVDIWQEVFKIDKIGIHDNFFELGGHSLLATQVLTRLRTRLQSDLPLWMLFEQPTVAELATALDHLLPPSDSSESENITELLDDIDALTEDEVQALLDQETQKRDET